SHPALKTRRVAEGSADMAHQPALTVPQFRAALATGEEAAKHEIAAGARLLLAGDVGIGNTTAAAALTALLCNADPSAASGDGAGATSEIRGAKERVVQAAVSRARSFVDLEEAIAAVAGFEIAAMAGYYLHAARENIPIILDGAISGAAALIAQALAP